MNEPIPPIQAENTHYTLSGIVLRAVSFVIGWWAFTEGSWREWYVAVAVIVFATWSSLHILPLRSWKWNLRAWLVFIPYFLRKSVHGGFDVAWRAMHPRMPLNPTLAVYQLRIPPDLPAVFLAWTVSLMPGTASVHLSGGELTIHVLTDDEHFLGEMQQLEVLIGRLFGLEVHDPKREYVDEKGSQRER